jgi:hypothetical protein
VKASKVHEALDAIEFLVEHSKATMPLAHWYRLEDAMHTLQWLLKRDGQ